MLHEVIFKLMLMIEQALSHVFKLLKYMFKLFFLGRVKIDFCFNTETVNKLLSFNVLLINANSKRVFSWTLLLELQIVLTSLYCVGN